MSARAGRPARRHVVVVFIDLVGSTELAERLDPELLRHVLDRYYRACATAIAEHGGVVEKYIGDAIMAAFGIPVSSEDDALRAVRAAHEALARVRRLGAELAPTHGIRLDVHCGISAGEAIVIDTPDTDLRVIGDTVNTASRLQSAADPGDILVGDEVARMVRDQARLAAMPPLSLKGKSGPVRAWRLLSPEPGARRHDDDQIPLIGRADETRQLHHAYRRAVHGRRCCVVTLLGLPGLGKSRLVRDFVAALPGDVTVLTGRCPSYGAGITYRPVTEMLESLGDDWSRVASLLEPESVRALRGLVDDGEETPGVAEISRAVRSLAETLARHRPLVLVWEDLHWAQPTLLDLIEDLATWPLDVPILLVCVARPELLDARPTWGGGLACAYALELGPLDRDEMTRLVAELSAARAPALQTAPPPAEVTAHDLAGPGLAPAPGQSLPETAGPQPTRSGTPHPATGPIPGPMPDPGAGPGVRPGTGHGVDAGAVRRVAECSDGNPLFAELMLETLAEEGTDAPLPPTIQALLGARLDRLGDGERDVLERAATIGHTFTLDQLAVLFQPGRARRDGQDPHDPHPHGDVKGGPAGPGAHDEQAGRLDGTAEPIRRLLRQRMIRRGDRPGTYQFTQTLTRDTVYAMTRKELRAGWHLALADRLAERPRDARPRPEGASFEESPQGDLAHHLESACLLTREVRPGDPMLPVLTERAARALIGAGTQALHRRDVPAALALLERGRELLPAGNPGHRALAVRICDAGLARGDRARAVGAADTAERMLPGDPRNRLTCAVLRATLDVRFGAGAPALGPLRDLLAADPLDHLSWCRFHQLEALVHLGEGRFDGAEAALRDGLARARSLGDRYEENRLLGGVCEMAQWSSTPVEPGLALCADLMARFEGDRALLVPVLVTRARLLALSGDIAAADAALATADRHVGDLRLRLATAAVGQVRGLVDSLAGRHAAAETRFRESATALRAAGQVTPAATLETYVAREQLRQGRPREAERTLDGLEASHAAGGLESRGELTLLALRARLAALSGDHDTALGLAARAEERLGRTDDPCLRGDVLIELADTYGAAGRPAESADAAARALRHYTAKGAALPAERARARLAAQGEEHR